MKGAQAFFRVYQTKNKRRFFKKTYGKGLVDKALKRRRKALKRRRKALKRRRKALKRRPELI